MMTMTLLEKNNKKSFSLNTQILAMNSFEKTVCTQTQMPHNEKIMQLENKQ